MNMFRITLTGNRRSTKKIQDIKEFREMTRNPFTGICCTLTAAKNIIETVYERDVTLEVSPEEAATILSAWANPDFCPYGWEISKVVPFKTEPGPLRIEYNVY